MVFNVLLRLHLVYIPSNALRDASFFMCYGHSATPFALYCHVHYLLHANLNTHRNS